MERKREPFEPPPSPAPYPSRLTLAFPPQSFSSSNWAVQNFLPKAVHQHAVGSGEGSDPAPSGWVSGCHSASDAYTNRTPPGCSSAFHPLEAYGCLCSMGWVGRAALTGKWENFPRLVKRCKEIRVGTQRVSLAIVRF